MSGKTYCVLGGGGAFGIHTAFYLLSHANPKKVIGVGRAPLRSPAFSLGIEKQPLYEYQVRHVTYDIHDLIELLDREKPEVIINFAAQGEGAVSWSESWRFFETNCVGLSRLCEELAKRDWLERFIQIGTSELYGSVIEPATEEAPVRPSSPYAASKLAFDFYLRSMHQVKGFPMNIIRPCNAYCPGQLLHRVIPKLIWCWLTGNKLPLQGGGKAEKSYIHARDLARAIYLVSESAPAGVTCNVGSKEPIAIRSIVEMCADVLGVSCETLCEVAPDRPGQDARYWLSSARMERYFGWEPQIGWQEGLEEMKRWGVDHASEIKASSTEYVLRP